MIDAVAEMDLAITLDRPGLLRVLLLKLLGRLPQPRLSAATVGPDVKSIRVLFNGSA